jgi:hypothetical protein
MTTHHPGRIAAAALTIAGLLVAACSSPIHPTAKGSHFDGGTARSSGTTSAAATALAATSSTTHTSAAAHPVAGRSACTGGSACTLITEKDITANVGTDSGKGSADEGPGASQCMYGSYQTQILLVNVIRS